MVSVTGFTKIMKELTVWKVRIQGYLRNFLSVNSSPFFFFFEDKFKSFDKDLSGDIDTFELAQAFGSIGIRGFFDPMSNDAHLNCSLYLINADKQLYHLGFTLSRKVQETIFRRYGGKKCRLTFEDFVHSCCKIVSLYGMPISFS